MLYTELIKKQNFKFIDLHFMFLDEAKEIVSKAIIYLN